MKPFSLSCSKAGLLYLRHVLSSNTNNALASHAAIQAVLATEKDLDSSHAKKDGGLRGKLNKVVLAYSGGLDTSVIVPWLRYYIIV